MEGNPIQKANFDEFSMILMMILMFHVVLRQKDAGNSLVKRKGYAEAITNYEQGITILD